MDIYGLAVEVLCYMTLAVMFCAEMRRCQEDVSPHRLIDFIAWQLIIAKA